MKLTDAERLILINQHRILAMLEAANEKEEPRNKWMIEELEGGFYENRRYDYYHIELQPSIPRERLDFADCVLELYEDSDKPFYGFEDPELNRYAEWCYVVAIREGTPPSDDEYRAMLDDDEDRIENRRAERVSEHQQVD